MAAEPLSSARYNLVRLSGCAARFWTTAARRSKARSSSALGWGWGGQEGGLVGWQLVVGWMTVSLPIE